ncbi:hypothetical protein SEMRO_2013_G310971.1 [Seminavis robusta]|uniref:Uncharacterized protein n=1 Tax=Seminavis robusta TaxID=568900 RepID=A0A9N8HVN5_9STRA|nr:hypothetical protein SEMRO_2013_G310971.1 [Seminavis robusta]|eukprot:Sro2013_g310971.1  (144) ;mRNA; r:12086-12517
MLSRLQIGLEVPYWVGGLLIHSICLYEIHKTFHSCPGYYYKYHKFHHPCNDCACATCVGQCGRICRVMLCAHFTLGRTVAAILLQPHGRSTLLSFNLDSTLSVFNLVIHTPKSELFLASGCLPRIIGNVMPSLKKISSMQLGL